MYTIRNINYEKDTLKIVELLRDEFGNRFSESFFCWKHLQNPFGTSFGLVAVDENDKIIGVRLFMWWQFKINNDIKFAIRPVDTTTDKRFRGMGIFKKLTLQGIDQLTGKYDFIFNTPNNNSLPGYLKMGWQKKLPNVDYYLNFVLPFSTKYDFINLDNVTRIPESGFNTNETNKTLSFVNWRYQDGSYKKAWFTSAKQDCLIIYKVLEKKIAASSINMIIVIDVIGDVANLKKYLKSICKRENCICYYFADTGNTAGLRNNLSIKRGDSVIAYRQANEVPITEVNFSAGDLEGLL